MDATPTAVNLVLATLKLAAAANPSDPVPGLILHGWANRVAWAVFWVSEKVKDSRFQTGVPNLSDPDLIPDRVSFDDYSDDMADEFPLSLKRGKVWKVRLGARPWSSITSDNFCPVCGSFGVVNTLEKAVGTCCGYCDRSALDLRKPPTARRRRRASIKGIEIPASLEHLLV